MAIELNNHHVSYGFIAAIMGDNLAFQKAITDAIEAKVDTLVGEDASKSARAIALEELTKQLIPENANEAMNTLQEIAAWLQAHPTEAAAINAAINKLKDDVDGINTDLTRLATMSDGANKTEVSAETITAGTKIATITIDGVDTEIMVPTVAVTAEATSGVKVGSVKVGDGDAVDLYIPDDAFATVDEAHALFAELTAPKAQ